MECSQAWESASRHEQPCYDVAIVGFGPAALSLAIALQESHATSPRILIIERGPSFSWKGKQLPMGRSQMRTNLIQDLVTARNPKSRFTFVNYLWSTDNLVAYTNLGFMNPPRKHFDMYLDWCAEHFDRLGWTQYGHEVTAVDPVLEPSGQPVSLFRVKTRDVKSGQVSSIHAAKVVLAPGLERQLPLSLSSSTPGQKIFHASDFLRVQPQLLKSARKCLKIAVVGSNDEAVEVLDHCLSLDRQVQVTLFSNGTSLQETDKNPFAGDAILASKTASLEVLSAQYGRSKSQPSIRSDALAGLYTRQYAQQIKPASGQDSPSFEVQQFAKIVGSETVPGSEQITLHLQSTIDQRRSSSEPFDCVFAVSDYVGGLQEHLIESLKQYFDDKDGRISTDAGYRINMNRRHVAEQAGLWLLNGYETGVEDSFSYMALRTDRVLRSILEASKAVTTDGTAVAAKPSVERAVL